MEKEEIVKKIEEMTIKLDGLKEELGKVEELENKKKNEVWKPETGERYFYINRVGLIDELLWANDREDNWNYITNNCFKTEEEAERRKFELELEGKIRLFQLENNEEIDLEDEKKAKYYLYYDNYLKAVMWCTVATKYIFKLGYFSSGDLAEQFICKNAEDLVKYFKG